MNKAYFLIPGDYGPTKGSADSVNISLVRSISLGDAGPTISATYYIQFNFGGILKEEREFERWYYETEKARDAAYKKVMKEVKG